MPLPNKPFQQTFEDDCTFDEILESAGILTLEQAEHLMDHIKGKREEEWDRKSNRHPIVIPPGLQWVCLYTRNT